MEQQKALLESELDLPTSTLPEVKHNFAERYQHKVRGLTAALDDPELRDSVSRDISSMIENIKIFPTLTDGKVDATLSGDLAGILSLTEGHGEPSYNCDIPMAVASPRDRHGYSPALLEADSDPLDRLEHSPLTISV